MKPETNRQELVVTELSRGIRLDRWLVEQCPQLSRARLQELIAAGLVLVNGAPAKASQKLRGGQKVVVEAVQRPPLRAEPESIPLDVVYEDNDLLIVNKPAGMSVHAGAGNSRGTLVNALLGRGQNLSRGGSQADALRPGIVHRLDKQTSGLIVIAKNDYSHAKLAESFRTRAVKKTYIALVEGKLEKTAGEINFPIGRDPVHRTRMKAFPQQSSQRGRTHQIRVHLSAVKHPLVGDTVYGGASKLSVGNLELPGLSRQFLHSEKLGFPHPRTGQWIEARAPLPQDLREFLDTLAAADGRSLEAASEYP